MSSILRFDEWQDSNGNPVRSARSYNTSYLVIGGGGQGGSNSGSRVGGGGGAGGYNTAGGNGGSGVVIISIPSSAQVTFSSGVTATSSTVGLNKVYTVTATATEFETVTIA